MNKIKFTWSFNKLFWWLFFTLILLMLLANSYQYLDPDFGWHLKVGQEMNQSGIVSTINHYNYTYTGSWVNHEWLADFYLYKIYEQGGYILLTGIFAGLALLSLVLIFIRAHLLVPGGNFVLLAALLLIALVGSLPSLGIRLQELSWLFLILLLLIMDLYQRRRRFWLLMIIPPLIFLWSCLHGGFLLGLALFLAWPGVKMVEILIKRWRPADYWDFSELMSGREIITIIGLWLLSLAATLLGPYQAGLYSFLGGYRDSFYKYHIQEWLSQFILPLHYWQLFFLAILAFALFLYFYHTLGKEKLFRFNLWQLLVVILFFYLAWESRRHFPLLVAATLPWIFFIFSTVFKSEQGTRFDDGRASDRWLKIYLSVVLILSSVHYLINIDFTRQPFTGFCSDYPCQAVEFLSAQTDYSQGRLLNHYAWGGYLIWVWPDKQIFIDGRLPQVSFAGHTFLQEYYEFFKKETDLSAKLRQYEIELVLWPAQDQVETFRAWEKWLFGIKEESEKPVNPLRDYLDTSQDWDLLYSDSVANIYRRLE